MSIELYSTEWYDTLSQIETPDISQPKNEARIIPLFKRGLEDKKVLVASESLGPINGVTRATQYFLEYLQEQNIKAAAVAPEFDKLSNFTLQKKVPILRLAGLPLFFNPDLLIARPFRVQKVFRRTFRPDIIYLASPASIGIQFWWQLRRSNIPMVANFQTDLSAYAKRMLPRPLNNWVSKLIDWVQGRIFQHPSVKAVLCPSYSSLKYLQSLGVPDNKLRLVRRGVDSKFFNPEKRSTELRAKLAPNNEILLLCVSRLSLEKGFDFLAEAYAEAVKRAAAIGLNQKFRLVITGGNSNKAIEQHIQHLFEKKGLDVSFTGPLTGESLAQMYASADIFVFPSLTETFGQVIQEAMGSGLPVVALRAGGPADLVQPGETGFLAEPGDVDVFAEKVIKLVQDSLLRRRMAIKARRIAENRSWDAINQQISRILAEYAL